MQVNPNLKIRKVFETEGAGFVYVLQGTEMVPFLLGSSRDGDSVLAFRLTKSETGLGLAGQEWVDLNDKCGRFEGVFDLRYDPLSLRAIGSVALNCGNLVHSGGHIGLALASSTGAVSHAWDIYSGNRFPIERRGFVASSYTLCLRDPDSHGIITLLNVDCGAE